VDTVAADPIGGGHLEQHATPHFDLAVEIAVFADVGITAG
jgi:hypothetical protein